MAMNYTAPPAAPNPWPPLRRVASLSGFTHFLDYALQFGRGEAFVTVSTGQPWDGVLQGGYDGGLSVLELNDDECVVAVYRRED